MKNVDLLVRNGVNVEKSLELFGDIETYNDTLLVFLSEIDNKLSEMQKHKEMGNMARYAILAHSLKSDARYFGFEKLATLALSHEEAGKENNMYFVTDNYDELMTEASRIVLLVKDYLGEGTTSSPIEPKKVVTNGVKAILVVDDSHLVQNFIQKIFSNTYEVLIAKDGNKAIRMIEDNEDKEIVGMLLDLNMPKVDGFEVLNYFLRNDLFDKIPVSIITGSDSRDVDERVFKYPIVDMLKKPFNERDIKSIVERTISSRQ